MNLGIGENEKTFNFWKHLGSPQPSAWIADLNENPYGRRKFTSVTIDLSPRLVVIQRETYDLLTWLGEGEHTTWSKDG